MAVERSVLPPFCYGSSAIPGKGGVAMAAKKRANGSGMLLGRKASKPSRSDEMLILDLEAADSLLEEDRAEATLEGIPYVFVPVDLRQELTRLLI
jgi:hypothetical protein